ncbi:WhiB family transcriptional regulator [Amycolatopsis sp. NPDC059090]|uniref:WhiB family transcriptional regulator n=1 Tax=unclassified Amycolatopsis TaxID=2618356 RepID=UPI00366B5365
MPSRRTRLSAVLDAARLADLHARFGDDTPACAGEDPELFWPVSPNDTERASHAKRICARCPVATACLDWAIRHENDGTWGGHTAAERGPARHRHATRERHTSPWRNNGHHTA